MFFESAIVLHSIFTLGFTAKAQDSWIEDIADRRMFVDGRVASMNDFLVDQMELDDDLDTLVSNRLDLKYTALKCKYADGVVEVMQSFYTYISFSLKNPEVDSPISDSMLKTAIDNNFIAMKPLFEEMTYNLFFYLDSHKQLWTTDQSVLKSILSVHAFLTYSQTNNPFSGRTGVARTPDENEMEDEDFRPDDEEILYAIRLLNNSIVQMVGLMDIFRCRHCVVGDIFDFLNDTDRDDDMFPLTTIKSKIDSLDTLVGNGPVNHDGNNYNAGMYDPENLMMGHLLKFHKSIIADAVIAYGDSTYLRLETVYQIVKNTYDMELVLNYQNFLFEIIGNIFLVQIYNLLGFRDEISKLKSLENSLNSFVSEILPNNCWSLVCDFIIRMKNVLNIRILEFDRGLYVTDDQINAMQSGLMKMCNRMFWTEDSLRIVNEVPLQSLVDSILKNKMFPSFRQVVELLSFESNTNRLHHIVNVHEIPRNITQSVGIAHSKYMAEIRYVLFRLWILLLDWNAISNKHKTVVEKNLVDEKKANLKHTFLLTTRYIKQQYIKESNDITVQNLIYPLLVHFFYVHQSFDVMEHFDFVKLEHMLVFTVSVMENFCFRAYKWPVRNVDIGYRPLLLSPDNSTSYEIMVESFLPVDEDDIKKYLKAVSKTAMFHNKFLPSDDDIYYYSYYAHQNIEFYFNGIATPYFEIISQLLKGIIYQQDLIRYRLITIKWLIAQLLMKLIYILTYSNDIIQMDKEGLPCRLVYMKLAKEFKELKFPVYSKEFVTLSIEMFISIMQEKRLVLNSDMVKMIISKMYTDLESLGVSTQQFSFVDLETVIAQLVFDQVLFENTITNINEEGEWFLNSKIKSLQFSTSLLPV